MELAKNRHRIHESLSERYMRGVCLDLRVLVSRD